ncbi:MULTISPECIES: carbohydrate-binding protein [unclassified Streptomyces]|uniref:carbohydrate-binding protein n=1 Tax=unclassified Streptomyces TaxID=2593676 RepID=UPI000FB649B7|nr:MULTISPECIES: carbohydrate-binding protein [unclassified Streptomyces]MCX4771680.1 dioxygenase [Streptomyces sp. NBC_01285]ROQ80964.1 carbohydrate binding protein [Streptomyces sp. CEV 2-1]
MTPDPIDRFSEDRRISRKTLLKAALVATAVPLFAGTGVALARDTGSTGVPLAPTPDCDDGDDPTHDQIEGPYFKPNSPLRTSLVTSGTPGVRLTASGYVFGRACKPIPGVLLDFWQADTNGAYDMSGFGFRGHQFTDASGAFTLSTVVAGLYPGRTRHIHVKAQAPGSRILTTQLYFPNEPRNNTDSIFDPALLMNVRSVGSGKEGSFDFVLDVAQDPTDPTDPPTGPGGSWASGAVYRAGDRVTYGGVAYRCLQAHTALTGWEPPNVPALWERG